MGKSPKNWRKVRERKDILEREKMVESTTFTRFLNDFLLVCRLVIFENTGQIKGSWKWVREAFSHHPQPSSWAESFCVAVSKHSRCTLSKLVSGSNQWWFLSKVYSDTLKNYHIWNYAIIWVQCISSWREKSVIMQKYSVSVCFFYSCYNLIHWTKSWHFYRDQN